MKENDRIAVRFYMNDYFVLFDVIFAFNIPIQKWRKKGLYKHE